MPRVSFARARPARCPAAWWSATSTILLDQLRKTASTDAFAQALDYGPHEPGDVLLITGVGEVYPLLRTHALLDNIQHLFSDIPLVVAYPGCYDGSAMRLFAGAEGRGLEDGNYYRAFSLV